MKKHLANPLAYVARKRENLLKLLLIGLRGERLRFSGSRPLVRGMCFESLEERSMFVVGAFEIPPIVMPDTGYDGVVRLSLRTTDGNGTRLCTGSLMPTGLHILTAAHCVTNEDTHVQNVTASTVFFDLPGGNQVVFDANVTWIHPAWDDVPDISRGWDAALITLDAIAPAQAERYEMQSTNPDADAPGIIVGYGSTGTGDTGELDDSSGVKRIGYTQINVVAGSGTGNAGANALIEGNFDNPGFDPPQDLGLSVAGLGAGDSGGPLFIRGRVAGIASFGDTITNFGDESFWSNVALYESDIDTQLNGDNEIFFDMNFQPQVANDGVPDLITIRRDPLAFNTVQILIGEEVIWSDRLTRVNSLAIRGSGDNDHVVIDGDFGVPITVDGGLGFDTLELIGDETGGGIYTPSATHAGDGEVDFAGDLVTFTNFEPLIVSALENFTLITPNSRDIVQVRNGPLFGQLTTSGTSDGIAFESLTIFDIADFSIGLDLNDNAAPNDILTIDAAIASTGLATFEVIGGNGNDTLVYLGTALNDVFSVNSASEVRASNSSGSLLTVSSETFEQIHLFGLDGEDLFTISGNANVEVQTHGGNSSAGSDVLSFVGSGSAITANLTTRTVQENAFASVLFSGVETVNVAAAGASLAANLTANDDELTYQPTGASAGTFINAGDDTTFHFTNTTGTFTVNALESVGDHLIVVGTNSHDRILVDSPNRTVSVTNAAGTGLKTVTMAGDLEIVTTQGRFGNDTFLVVPSPIVGTSNMQIHIDGGGPGASDALVIATAAGATLPASDFVVNAIGLNPGEGRVRVFRNATSMPDISYSDIEIVSPIVVVTGGVPQLLILGPDVSEPNEFRTTAMHLGAADTINLDNLAIFPNFGEHVGLPADQDFFQIVAKTTGTIAVTAFFETYAATLLPGGGQLGLTIIDDAGNVVAGNGVFGAPDGTPNARVRFPAVAGRTYYIRVAGTNADGTANNSVVGGYELSVVNDAPPVPQNLELLDNPVADVFLVNSDTGRSQFDNVTRDNTPTLVFRMDDAIFLNDLPGNNAVGSPPDEVIPIPFQAVAGTAGFRIAIFGEGSSPAPGNQFGPSPQVPLGFATFVSPGVYQFTTPALSDGSHFLTARVQILDPSTPQQTGFGERSVALEIVVDTAIPTGFFGQVSLADTTQGLAAESDSGVDGYPATFVDRVTNDTTPTVYGRAEANAIVRVYAETNGVAGLQSSGAGADLFLGLTVASPLDGSSQFPGGQWSFTTQLDLNNPNLGFAKDGLRNLYMTSDDVAGNTTTDATADRLSIFLDTAGPQVTDVQVTGFPVFNLFGLKPDNSIEGPTPRVDSLTIRFQDLPNRSNLDPNFLYAALQEAVAETRGNFVLRGDHTGIIAIKAITFIGVPPANGATATGSVALDFFAPLPDDRYTLTIKENVFDPVGNKLDGESDAAEPIGNPNFASGHGQPGGDFVARFTVDSRPEFGTVSQGLVYVDINGNFEWDPTGSDDDATNRDFVFQMGTLTDAHFAGNFSAIGAAAASGFDKLGVYGRFAGVYSFLIDTNDDGVGNVASPMPSSYQVNGIPVAGNFNAAHPGDEIGLFDGQFWYLDTNGNNLIDIGEKIQSNFNGLPLVGDFDGNGQDDLATYVNDTNTFFFDMNRNGTFDSTWEVRDTVKRFAGLSGFTDRPLVGDLNLDGVDDIGLWVKGRSGQLPVEAGEFYFWVSDRKAATPSLVFDSYSPAPLGNDLFAQFGDENALPVFGNFDPPIGDAIVPPAVENFLHRKENALDVDGNNFVSPLDALIIINWINSRSEVQWNDPIRGAVSFQSQKIDTNGDGVVSPIDVLLVINAINLRQQNVEGEATSTAEDIQNPPSVNKVNDSTDAFFRQFGYRRIKRIQEADTMMVRK